MRVQKAVDIFLKELGKERAEKTVESYADSLHLFTWYLEDWAGIRSLKRVGRENIEEFLSWWYIRKFLPSSASGAKELLKTLRKFFGWLQTRGLTDLAGDMEEIYQALKEDLPNSFKIQEMLYREGELLSYLIDEGRASFWERQVKTFVFQDFFGERWHEFSAKIRSFLAKGPGKYIEGGYFEVIDIGSNHIRLKGLETGRKIGPVLIFNEECLKLLKKGFIIYTNFYKIGKEWGMIELGFVYPPLARGLA